MKQYVTISVILLMQLNKATQTIINNRPILSLNKVKRLSTANLYKTNEYCKHV